MLIPLSWLKDFVEIKIPMIEMAKKLSSAGLTVEKWEEKDGDIVFDTEVTPNRPDWMSVYGVAREIAAITKLKIKSEKLKIREINRPKNPLPLTIKPNYKIVPRITSVIIRNVQVKPSPGWLQKRLRQVGLRPINNLVDITNYILWAYGSLLHVFDYDKIRGHQMLVEQARGGEPFRSLDGLDYILPKDAVIIKDVGRIIDLLPLKGGENTAASNQTKNVLLHSVVCDPVLTRRTSQALNLRSDSSAIAERGLDPNGTIRAVNFALALILELAGGEVGSEIIDHKEKEFLPWTVNLSHQKLESILGIKIEPERVRKIFAGLELKTTYGTHKTYATYRVEIPTFRNDLHIEEDLIEEVGRIIGYDNFPKTLPTGPTPTAPVAYKYDFDFDYEVKQLLKGAGYSEIYTYSLVSEQQLINLGIDPAKTLRIDNSVSKEYEYLRPQILGNLLEAVKLNQPNFAEIKLYELGKHYLGETVDKAKEEYWLSGAETGERFYEVKGTVESLLTQMGITYKISPAGKNDQGHPGRTAIITSGEKFLGSFGEIHPALLVKFGVKGHLTGFTLNFELLKKLANPVKKYQPVPKYPAVIEDVSLIIPKDVLMGEIMEIIKSGSKLVAEVGLIDTHGDSKTFRLTYLDRERNLTDAEVAKIRAKILTSLKEKGIKLKS